MINNLNRVVEFKYKLLDKQGVFKKDLFNIKSCDIEYLSLSRLKMSARITMADDTDIDFLNDLIQVICVIDDIETPVGQFIIASPVQDIEIVTERTCDCYSKLLYFDWDKLRTRLVLPAGTNVVNEVKRQIGTGYTFDIPDSLQVTSTVREWEVGTPKLDIINDLLNSINYETLTVNSQGTFVSSPYVLPENRPVEITYDWTLKEEDYTAKKFNGIEKSVKIEFDAFDIPNIFVRYTNNLQLGTQLVSEYVNNRADSKLSVINRVPITNCEEVTDVTDLTTLQAITKRNAVEWTQKYESVEFSTAIYPYHDYLTCVYLKVYNVNSKFIETSWSMECRVGGKMNHRGRRAISI